MYTWTLCNGNFIWSTTNVLDKIIQQYSLPLNETYNSAVDLHDRIDVVIFPAFVCLGFQIWHKCQRRHTCMQQLILLLSYSKVYTVLYVCIYRNGSQANWIVHDLSSLQMETIKTEREVFLLCHQFSNWNDWFPFVSTRIICNAMRLLRARRVAMPNQIQFIRLTWCYMHTRLRHTCVHVFLCTIFRSFLLQLIKFVLNFFYNMCQV